MNAPQAYANATEAVGLFTSAEEIEAAVDELESHGFDRADISLIASRDAVERALGHSYRSARELEDEPHLPTTAFVSREALGAGEGAILGALIYLPAVIGTSVVVASGGALAAAIAAAAIGGGVGAAFGALLARLVGQNHADFLTRHLERGGLLLFVRTRDAAHEATAQDVLKRHSGQDVHLHTIPSLTE